MSEPSNTAGSGGGNGGENGSERDERLIEAARAQANAPGSGSGVVRGSSGWRGGDIAPTLDLPNYEVVREIHRGGQGTVYLAIQKGTKRKVAIKVLHAVSVEGGRFTTRDRARFDREVQILGQMAHPNIVSIHESGVTPRGAFYFVMDYISGQTLDAWIKSDGRTVEEALRLFGKICDAVNAAHLKGVIHRDLKPGNIRVDGAGVPHVLDFGLAKVATGEVDDSTHLRVMTMTGQFVGSLPWASPEQAEGAPQKIDIRTDVYSLGVILYQMLTGGRFPYRVIGNMRDVLDNILRAEPARPSTVRRQINNEVETIVLKCLSKERERRYQSAGELGRDVARYLTGDPIEAKRDSGWYVIRKTLRRRRGVAATVALFATAMVVWGASMTAMYGRATRAERSAVVALEGEREAREAERSQRERAESNFDAVRGIARTMIVDFNDEIRELRGATAARDRLLREARAYLEKVRAQGDEDVAFLRELADAHDRVGELLAGVYGPSTRQSSEGEVGFGESRRLRERVLARLPTDARAHADVARSMQRSATLMQQERKYADALAQMEEAIAGCDRALSFVKGSEGDVRAETEALRAACVTGAGDLAMRLGEEAREPGERAGRAAEALGRYDSAASYWRSRARDEGAGRALAMLASKRSRVLLLLAESGESARFDEAREAVEEALAAFERIARESPASRRAQRDVWIALHHRGDTGARIARRQAEGLDGEERAALVRAASETALADYTRAVRIAGQLAADEENVEAQRDLALCLNKQANTLLALGREDEAERVYGESLRVRRALQAGDPTARHTHDLFVGLVKAGEAALRRSESMRGETAEAAREEARVLLLEAGERIGDLVRQGVHDAESGEVRELRGLLERAGVSAETPTKKR
ncbi:MAG: protein kinase [Phycisphaerales bacterium]